MRIDKWKYHTKSESGLSVDRKKELLQDWQQDIAEYTHVISDLKRQINELHYTLLTTHEELYEEGRRQ